MSHFNLFNPLKRLMTRWRYPVCCPEDIAQALGIRLTNQLTFEELVCKITSPHCSVNSLYKYMNRTAAEAAFGNALQIECFHNTTLVSYYFTEGWLVFNLHFDKEGKLSRLFIQHQCIPERQGIEIALRNPDGLLAMKRLNMMVSAR
jgi:hypothetical protein